MDRIALFPGSFDPITIGHETVVRRALGLFDKIIIAIGVNTNKPGTFPVEKRLEWIRKVFADEPKVTVDYYTDLTVEYCKKVDARFLLRGIRTSADFEYERAIAQVNKMMHPEIESVFLLTLPEHTPVNSTIVKDIILHGGDASKFLPKKLNMEDFKF